MSTLELDGVAKRFGTTVALAQLDLAVAEGELIALLGPSGCGKTTALRIVAGFERPDSGDVRVGGQSLRRTPPNRRGMGMVFQAYSLFPHLSAIDNVAFGLRRQRVDRAQARRGAGEMLDLVGLGDRGESFPHQMSGGQQQRVALARALAIKPKVLLLDEPLSALDAKVRDQLRGEIRRIQREMGITTLFVTHDQEEALAMADRVGVMSNGRLEQLAAPADVYDRPATEFVARFVGRINSLPGVVAADDAVAVDGVTLAPIAAGGRPPGSAVEVLVRPEHVRLGPPMTGELTGRIIATAFRGPRSEVTVRSGDQVLTVDIPSAETSAWSADDEVAISFDVGRAVVSGGRP